MKQKLTQERLKELLDYDPDTGMFTWKVNKGTNAIKGDIAGSLDTYGYCRISIDNKRYKAHRLVFLYVDGYLPENDIDHIDRNKINNRRNNLREVSRSCNMRNCNVYKTNKSGITGVYFNKKSNKWHSEIKTPKKSYLGTFDKLIDAAKARWDAEVKYNFPNCNTTSSAYVYLKNNGGL